MSKQGIVPVDAGTPHYSESVALGASVYVLTFRYNSRMDRWIMDIADSNANTLLTGMPVLSMASVLRTLKGSVPGLPKGLLFAADLSGAGADPQLATFGAGCPLFYWER
jgi:hypothetical protein